MGAREDFVDEKTAKNSKKQQKTAKNGKNTVLHCFRAFFLLCGIFPGAHTLQTLHICNVLFWRLVMQNRLEIQILKTKFEI